MNNLFNINISKDIEAKIKLTDKVNKIKINNKFYVEKRVSDSSLENIFQKMDVLSLPFILMPLSNNNTYIQTNDEKYYLYYPYLKEDFIQGYDLKISFYIKFIADLHDKTKIYINQNDTYFETIINHMENEISRISNSLESRIEVIERSDYHSPNDWYFLMNYHYLSSSLELASRHLMNFEREIKSIDKFKLCLTYQNFNFDHIFIKNQKIISIEKLGYNSPVVDIVDFIKKNNVNKIKLDPYILEYLKIIHLEEYEKEYLMSLLYIIDYHRFDNDKDDLIHLINLIEYIKIINNIEENIIFSSESIE